MKISIIVALCLAFLLVTTGCAKQETLTNTDTQVQKDTPSNVNQLPASQDSSDITQVDNTIKETDTISDDVVNQEEINDLSLTDVDW